MTKIEQTSWMLNEFREDKKYHNTHDQLFDTLTSTEAYRVVVILFSAALTGIFSVFGSASNVVNVIIFFKQGFNDSVNINLFALSVSDIGLALPLVWSSICWNPLFHNSDIGFDALQLQYPTSALPHTFFVRTTSWITTFVTFERCVCIALPMKVKDIITSERTFMSIIFIVVVTLVSISPYMFAFYYVLYPQVERNISLIGLKYTANGRALESISLFINVSMQLNSFIILVICTGILICKLKAKSQWRRSARLVSSGNSNYVSLRDKKVIKMVTLISTIYVICYLPSVVNLILMVYYSQEYRIYGQYHNTYQVSWSIIMNLKAINSAINIFVYYNLSSKFRAIFIQQLSSASMSTKDF